MKIRPSIYLFIVVAIVLIALVLWHGRKRLVETPPIVTVATNIVPPATMAASVAVHTNVSASAARSRKGANLSKNPPLSQTERAIGLLSDYNDQPIVFYGKVEDQFSNPVANAAVTFGVRIYNGHESTVKSGQVTSDANGLFTISGYKGQSLGLGVKKEGYVLVSMNGSGIYSKLWPENQRAHPDLDNPTIIKMWKLQGAEPLLNIDKTYRLYYTNAPINFDLLAGQVVPSGGDLSITATRPAGIISGRNPQDWRIDVKVIDGGFIETSQQESATTYAAPKDGYQPSGIFHKNNGPNLIDKTFFIQSRNGQVYSKIHLLFGINRIPSDFMYITFKGAANTNSSRNWEATAPQ